MSAERSVPRLANDSARAWIASGIGAVLSFIISFGYAFYVVGKDQELVRLVAYSVSGLASLFLIFITYELMTWWTFRRADAGQLADWITKTTPRRAKAKVLLALSGGGATSWSAQAAVIALVAVIVVAFPRDLRGNLVIVVLGLLVVASSWVMVIVSFAIGYLRHNVEHAGLEFPGDRAPTWDDYVYLAVQVSTTFSTSDVTVVTTAMRRKVTAQSVIAFVFNTVIVALVVSAMLTFAPNA